MKKILVAVLFACMTVSLAVSSGLAANPKVKVGVQPWLGYGPWWIAEQMGYFEKHGLDGQIVNFTWDADMIAGLASGKLDVIAAATNALIATHNKDVDLKGFLVLDASFEADAILAPKSVKSIKDIKGKKVAYEAGATSDLLINYALKANGMSIADVKPVNMAASDAGLALVAGRVGIAVTYEPYISAALKQGQDYHVLYTSAEKPGLVSDVAMATGEYIEKNPEVIKALAKVWDDAVTYLKNNPDEGGKIIADAVHSPMDEYKLAMEGVRVYDLAENKKMLGGEFQQAMTMISEIMLETNPKDMVKMPEIDKLLAVEPVAGM
ncbi:ABC transporter substrate-binding protein [Desulfopila sp. IMCC35008]|uniref:ABC transporter substrate-binding protein n=1 Tax=Desulfopila sp. IMCC35008 TaxID=2653858 RepID=UPI0013D88D9B|nr:ABC transporter substrate-binding protein [Desulfopila sp. IMCC35008]